MTRILNRLLLSIAFILGVTSLHAEPMGHGEHLFDPMRPDNTGTDDPRPDGLMTKEIFADMDANHDGALDREELKNMPSMARYFDRLDSNGDGKLTREEMMPARDKQRSGNVSSDAQVKPQ